MDSFFGIGMFELVMIAVVALIVLGPERLPGAMREIAKYARQLRDLSGEFQSQFSEELQLLDEINPKRIINDALDPSPKQQTKPAPKPQSSTKPLTTTAKPAPAKPAVPEPAVAKPSTIQPSDDESANTILPPAKAAELTPPAAANGADSASPDPGTAQAEDAEAPAEDAR